MTVPMMARSGRCWSEDSCRRGPLFAALLASMPALIGPAMRGGTSPRARVVDPRLWIGGIETGAQQLPKQRLFVVRAEPTRLQSEMLSWCAASWCAASWCADVELVRSQRSELVVDTRQLQAQFGSDARQPLRRRGQRGQRRQLCTQQ